MLLPRRADDLKATPMPSPAPPRLAQESSARAPPAPRLFHPSTEGPYSNPLHPDPKWDAIVQTRCILSQNGTHLRKRAPPRARMERICANALLPDPVWKAFARTRSILIQNETQLSEDVPS